MKKIDFSLSVIVTTYNWENALDLVMESLLNQSVLPNEILIADDGSRQETSSLVEGYQKSSLVPIHHVWQEDDGFRAGIIRNKAIAKATGDYVILIDGDVILDRHFIKDHLEMAQPGHFVCGSRVKLNAQLTRDYLMGKKPPIWKLPLGFILNSIRFRMLRSFLAFRYARDIGHLRGCNWAFWREDLIRANGFNEDLTGWGHEDTELAYRVHFCGVKKKSLKMGGIVYHLWHRENSKENEGRHFAELDYVKNNRISRCKNGLSKYL